MKAAAKDVDAAGKAGCIMLFISFAVIEGGIVLTAWSLHQIFGDESERDPVLVFLAGAGVLIVLAGPQLWFAATRSWPRLTWPQAVAALPDFLLAGWFVLGWAAPAVIGMQAAGMLPGVMALEFIIIHASVGLVAFPQQMARSTRGDRWWKSQRAMMIWLLLMYSVTAAGISASFKSAWLFAGFWLLIANKFLDDWLTPAVEAEERKQRHLARWGTSAGLYLFLAFGSVFIPVPELGAVSASEGGGLWEQNPEQAVAMGAMYFILLAFCELYGGFNNPPASEIPKSPE